MSRRVKFWLFLLLGATIYGGFSSLAIVAKVYMLAIPFLAGFILYCYFLYRFVCRGVKPKYPLIPPEGRTDIYLPRTDIPRPIHEDVRRYPEFFKKKRKKFLEEKNPRRKENVRRKK